MIEKKIRFIIVLMLGFVFLFSACDNIKVSVGDVGSENVEVVEDVNSSYVEDESEDVEELEDGLEDDLEDDLENVSFEGIKVANWNLQIFGQSKASNDTLMEFYVSVIDDYDIVFIQEIRDSSQTAFVELCDMLNGYSCEVSSRAGRSSSKEQYGVIYRNGIEVIEFVDYNPDELDKWERPPIKVVFGIGNYSLTVYNIHTKPDDVEAEMAHLEEIIVDDGNVLLFGDLNADCSYYNNEEEVEFDSWNWVVSDEVDTTVSATDCAYDRIIVNEDLGAEAVSYGVYTEGIDKEVSDHYLIWLSLGLDGVEFLNETSEDAGEDDGKSVNESSVVIVKMSDSGICHDENSSYYSRIVNFVSYDSLEKCLGAGGRLVE